MRRYLPASYLALAERETALDHDLEVVDADTRRLLKLLLVVLAELIDGHLLAGFRLPADPGGQRLLRRLLAVIPFPSDLVHIIEDEASLRATGESIFLSDEVAERVFGPGLEHELARKSTKH
jgi:hypothetical protein